MDVNGPRCQHASVGPLLCILSAAGFGAMAIFGKLAYEEGIGVGDLLLARFALAAAALLALAWARGALRGLSRRAVLVSLAMGAVGYATQSGLFFSALERMDASLLALILYTYPVLVCAAAVALGRERASARQSPRCWPRRPARRWCSPARRRGASTRSAPRWASAPRSRTRRTSSSATAW